MKCKVCNSVIDADAKQCDKCLADLSGSPTSSSLPGKQNAALGCSLMLLSVFLILGGFVWAVDQYFHSGMGTANAIAGLAGILALGLFIFGLIKALPRK